MNKLTCIIVDDEFQNQMVIDEMLKQFFPHVSVLGLANGVSEAVTLINEMKPDLVFLDVEMPGENGFELFNKIPNPEFLVVFTTAHADYVIRAIRCAALDYLLKPINLKELNQAISKAVEQKRSKGKNKLIGKQLEILKLNNKEVSESKEIALKTNSGISVIKIKDVIRCEADKDTCTFYIAGGMQLTVSSSIEDYDQVLTQMSFIRLQRKTLVNTDHIKNNNISESDGIVMSDDRHYKISDAKRVDILRTLNEK